MSEVLLHYGTPRHSGRYPWGSGKDPQRSTSLLGQIEELKRKGLSETDIAKGLGLTTTQLRAQKSIAKNEKRKADMAMATRLHEKGMSNVAIGKRMGLNESSVRALLDPALEDKTNILKATTNMLKENVDKKGYIDVGSGVEATLGISSTKLATAVSKLAEEGYTVHKVKVEQLGTGKFTTVKVLAPPDTKWSEVIRNTDKIHTIQDYSEDGGRTYLGLEKPTAISSKRLLVKYADDGGSDMDGVIQVRRGVSDISLGNARYAQVRVSIDGTHYLKGMAMYSDNMPDGVDLVFNTSKNHKANKLDALKPMKDDPDNPFGASVRQRHYIDKDGKTKLSAMNVVNEEGDWENWSRTLSSQMLSKQSPALAKKQLDISYNIKKDQYDEIMRLTNPTIKKKLLESFADDCDSSSVHLKAAALPRQRTHVILPVPSMKPTEVYAPNYRNGEKVVLIRFPHGGTFEIPELTVNNKQSAAQKLLKNARDAIGIHPSVASRLSGADFDGDTVLVIPDNRGKIRTSSPLAGLKNFEPKTAYPAYPGMKVMSAKTKQQKMGDVSNLITDMTIRGANASELARAVRHSMVVIDAEKHKLNWKQSYIDNNIAGLKEKYQGGKNRGASTLISRASSETRVLERKERSAAKGGAIDPATGKKMYENTGRSYTKTTVTKGGVTKTQVKYNQTKSTKMAEVDNAFELSSGTPIESVYATHANKLKALGNQARKSMVSTKSIAYSPSARQTYAPQVSTLKAKLGVAVQNQPRERQAQLLANTVVRAKLRANPKMDHDDLKKVKGQALAEARSRMGAKKTRIDIEPKEWEAIQAGAISASFLSSILNNTDLDKVKQLATPRSSLLMTNAKTSRARMLLANGYTQSEVADALGVSISTLNKAL